MSKVKIVKNILSRSILQNLIDDFSKGIDTTYTGRRFKVDIGYAQKLLMPLLKEHLQGDWYIDGGNYFESIYPYRLHCDSGKNENKKLYYNIVIPIQLWTRSDFDSKKNKLIITDQEWTGHAAFFVKGDDTAKNEYNECIRDYDKIQNLKEGIDPTLENLCTHLNPKNLEGFTIQELVDWEPGDIIMFPRTFIHATSNWRRAGVDMKLGLSLFSSYNDPISV